MHAKNLSILLFTVGLLFTLAQCGRLTVRNHEDDDNSNDDNGDNDNSNDDLTNEKRAIQNFLQDNDDDDLSNEKRAIQNFLQDEEDASQFLDQSRRLFTSDQKSHMKEAKKAYEEKCERLLHPRYCPDLDTWLVWTQAFKSATGKK
ncbi:unnamed protein product [Adineta steineri]|uniref:Uncharacterized protein n=1 Tax=Adineta steineri TaxID=433720 RepID=A0A814HP45_9BILA|nr:unnamed protein product [Adineta steineri]CAF3507458.1 unnamed protein product [Adineta steineri]